MHRQILGCQISANMMSLENVYPHTNLVCWCPGVVPRLLSLPACILQTILQIANKEDCRIMNCSILMFTNSLAGGGRDFGTISKERIQMDCKYLDNIYLKLTVDLNCYFSASIHITKGFFHEMQNALTSIRLPNFGNFFGKCLPAYQSCVLLPRCRAKTAFVAGIHPSNNTANCK